MGIEIKGTIHTIFETKHVSERFTKREFVVTTDDNPKYPQTVLFQITGDKTSQLDDMRVGDQVRIDFSVRGREWKSPSGEVKYFNSLDCWRVELIAGAPRGQAPKPAGGTAMEGSGPILDTDDIPFGSADIAHEPSPIARVIR